MNIGNVHFLFVVCNVHTENKNVSAVLTPQKMALQRAVSAVIKYEDCTDSHIFTEVSTIF